MKKDFDKIIAEIDSNKVLNKKYLINDLIKIRVHALLKAHPPKCSTKGCNLPIDNTTLGWDTSCPYHRLLFDHWLYEVVGQDINHYSQKGRRNAFTRWINKTGKKECDKIVKEMSKDGINWEC